MEEDLSLLHHSVFLKERTSVVIEGVKKLDSFDKEDFLVDTYKGYMHICGKDLSLSSMDMEKGHLGIEGQINSISYLEKNTKNKESFLKRLFK